MNCHDAREGFRALLHGGMGLTEWALLDAHVRQCVECRKERESVQEVLNSRQQVTPSRALLHCLSQMIDSTHLGTTSFAARLPRVRVLLSISLTVSGQAAVRMIEASRVGVTWLVGLLTRVRSLLPKLFKLFVWVAAIVIEGTGFVVTGFADLLARLRSSLTIAGQGVARAAIEAARAGVTRLFDVLLLVRGLLPVLLKLSERAAANAMGAARFASVRCADLLARLRVPLSISLTVSGQAAVRMIEASRVGVTWLSERAAVKAIGAMWVVGRTVVATSRRALSLPGLSAWISTTRRRGWTSITNETMSGSARTSTPRHKVAAAWSSTRSREPLTSSGMTSGTRSLLRVSTGIASLAVLVATIQFLWPPEWPDNFMPRPATGDRLSQDVRPPADRKPAEPADVAPLAETRTPKSVSAPQPAPAAVSEPETRHVAVRPKPPETQAEISAPLPSPDPALAQSRAAASAPTPTPEATWSREPSRLQESARSQDGMGSQNAEASDPIDWLLTGGRGTNRRYIESP